MKAVTILIIAGIAGFMAYLAYVGECPGGTVVRSEQQCLDTLNAAVCTTIFSRAKEVAENSNTVYMNPIECSTLFGACLNHATIIGGYTPTPARFCIKNNGTSLTSMEPIYQRAGAR
jgi:uncharacterized protein YgiB involved in biofilm formation